MRHEVTDRSDYANTKSINGLALPATSTHLIIGMSAFSLQTGETEFWRTLRVKATVWLTLKLHRQRPAPATSNMRHMYITTITIVIYIICHQSNLH